MKKLLLKTHDLGYIVGKVLQIDEGGVTLSHPCIYSNGELSYLQFEENPLTSVTIPYSQIMYFTNLPDSIDKIYTDFLLDQDDLVLAIEATDVDNEVQRAVHTIQLVKKLPDVFNRQWFNFYHDTLHINIPDEFQFLQDANINVEKVISYFKVTKPELWIPIHALYKVLKNLATNK